ncbi:unnamed protein product [Mycena citricolor]|uniref:Uncharacterized protein n=1 Tax=Mycena citricolor TaxID=2018698 RepID=A0AAD2H234_9AGAR|nr:unnamed protein product [Mycena citricolor]
MTTQNAAHKPGILPKTTPRTPATTKTPQRRNSDLSYGTGKITTPRPARLYTALSSRPQTPISGKGRSEDGDRTETTPKGTTRKLLTRVSDALGFSPPRKNRTQPPDTAANTSEEALDHTIKHRAYNIPTFTSDEYRTATHDHTREHGHIFDGASDTNFSDEYGQDMEIDLYSGDPEGIINAYTVCMNDAKVALNRLRATIPEILETEGFPQEVVDATRNIHEMVTGRETRAILAELETLRLEASSSRNTAERKMNSLQDKLASRDQLIDKMGTQLDNLSTTVTAMAAKLDANFEWIQKAQQLANTRTTPTNAGTQPQSTLGPTYRPTKTITTTPNPKANNPLMPHHPTRLIIKFNAKPTEEETRTRPDQKQLVTQINEALQSDENAKHLRVVALKWTANGNCVLQTRADQTGEELAKFSSLFQDILTKPGQISTIQLDRKWTKIQVDLVRTGAFDMNPTIYGQDTLMQEALINNPILSRLKITNQMRWLRRPEDLTSVTTAITRLHPRGGPPGYPQT